MTAARSWKETLRDRMPESLAREIEIFETQIEFKKAGKIGDKMFAETRLRRGVYGQRYDNGRRHDGEKTQTLDYPCESLTKGPETVWDAPGMMRIKIPLGKVTPDQLDLMCELAEEYSDQILHVTTRQDIQLHFIHIEDTPDLMRRLAAVDITTREACGNSVRNVTACQYAGVCNEQTFDVTPYAHAAAMFLLGHDDVQDFGRKLKPAFSGCKDNPCGLVTFHDIGCIAQVREVDGKPKRGFEFYVGGGLGAVPHPAKLLEEFTPEEELLPMMQAVCRVFARLGEKENRSRARLKFLVNKLGIEEFTRLVKEERTKLRPDPRWTAFLDDLANLDEKPLKPGSELAAASGDERFRAWFKTNVRPQAQPGYSCAIVTLPLGDFSPDQGRIMSDLAREFTNCSLRLTVDQNILFRWVSTADLPELFARLDAAGLGASGAETISDITSCPGTDTCKLGISSSRGLAGELRRHLSVGPELPAAAQELHIKCSGCFNSCGQHHVADIGFLGVARNVSGRRVPHFQLVVGGQWTENAKNYGLAIGAIPSKNVPLAVDRLTKAYAEGKREGENYREYVGRVGKKTVRQLIEDLTHVPSYAENPSFYSDWGDPREYTTGDMGVGECAGEIVPFVEMGLADSERELFEAQVILDEGNATAAAERAYQAMLHAAKALTRERNANLGDDPDEIVREFKLHLCDTRLFHDPYVGDKFANFLFSAHGNGTSLSSGTNATAAHQRIEEAQLFVEAAHQCYIRNASPAS